MTIHHFATILLIAGSYVIGHWRIGSVIIVVHDAADFWLEVRFPDSLQCICSAADVNVYFIY